MNMVSLIWQYLQIGYTHVLPLGFDHLLFILSLFFMLIYSPLITLLSELDFTKSLSLLVEAKFVFRSASDC
jgi:hypothetical protein